jgi:hypothetical protein
VTGVAHRGVAALVPGVGDGTDPTDVPAEPGGGDAARLGVPHAPSASSPATGTSARLPRIVILLAPPPTLAAVVVRTRASGGFRGQGILTARHPDGTAS